MPRLSKELRSRIVPYSQGVTQDLLDTCEALGSHAMSPPYRVRHMTIEEHARTVAANWVYKVYAWRGRSSQFMQTQVSRLADEIAAAETIAYEAGAAEAIQHAEKEP